MPAVVTRVFLSSTVEDLKEYRKAVIEAVDKMEGYQCVVMERFGARPDTPANVCRQKVGECDIFVGIVGALYGSSPPDSELSFTEIEYEAAVEFGKPRLMFRAPDDIPLPSNLREADDRNRRQKQFRDRVRADLVSDSFRAPGELATLVSTAITNLGQGGASALKEGRQARAGRQKPAPNASQNVSRMCDRAKQEADFMAALGLASRHRPGFPLACVVHGEERENHKSFIQRLHATKIQDYAKTLSGRQRGSVKHLRYDEWPSGRDPASARSLLKYDLFQKLAPHYGLRGEDYSAADLRRLLGQSLAPVFIFEHKIMARQWGGETAGLLRWYLEFWDEVKGGGQLPQCFVFFKLVYPDARRGGPWNVWRRLSRANPFGAVARARRAVRRTCRLPERAIDPAKATEPGRAKSAAAAHCALVLLEELTCVGKEHVVKWLDEHTGIGDEREVEQKAINILTDERGRLRKCRNMRAVESNLFTLHTEITREAVRKR
jgi:hypothetical protein